MPAPMRTSDFIQSFGVNTHMAYTSSAYVSSANVIADLSYLGLDNVRDSVPLYSQQTAALNAMAAAGIKFDFLALGSVDPTAVVSSIAAFAAQHPGSVTAVEGLNEVDNFPVTYHGLSGTAAATAYMTDLLADLANSATLSTVKTFDLTGAQITDSAAVNNFHPYPANGSQPYQTLDTELQSLDAFSTKPSVITEAGYYTAPASTAWGGVDQLTQAKETLNLLMDATKLGVSQTYLYQLLDPYSDSTGVNVDENIGLFDINGKPKLAATAIHNLTTILADTGSTASTFQSHAVNYTLSAQDTAVSSLELQKSSGATDVVLWSEPTIWNEATQSEISVAASAITVNFGTDHVNLTVYDPLSSTTPIATYANVTTVTVNVSDHPVIIEATDATTGGAPAANGTNAIDPNTQVFGDSGNNTLVGTVGVDTMTGGTGNDTYVVNNASDVVVENANEGTDTILSSVSYHAPANVEALTLTGTAAIDAWANDTGMTLTGNSAVNHLYGGAGNDTLNGGAGADVMTGGAGDDTYYVDNTADVVVENAGGGNDQIFSTATYHAPANVETLTLTGTAAIDAYANDQTMTLIGNSGANHLYSGAGVDTLMGGAGNDTYTVNNAADVVVENANAGTDTILSSVSYHAPVNVEALTLTGTANLAAWANDTGTTLTGNAGTDNLYGGAGNDTLVGGTGVATMAGGTGNDTYVVNNASDVVVENASAGIDTILSSVSYHAPVNVEALTLTGTANLSAWANDTGMTLTGNAGTDYLYGGAGNDTLVHGTGVDTMAGGKGDDIYLINNASDEIVENPGEGYDYIYTSVSYHAPANVENLTLTGTANIDAWANDQGMVLTGNTGANDLYGGAGNDILNGGAGNDTLHGGGGSDMFIFGIGGGNDIIDDFTIGADKLDLSAFIKAGLNPTLTDNAAGVSIGFSTGESIELLAIHSQDLHHTTTGLYY